MGLIREKAFFRTGFTLGDILEDMSRRAQPHICLHSDWLLGFFTERYLLTDANRFPKENNGILSLDGVILESVHDIDRYRAFYPSGASWAEGNGQPRQCSTDAASCINRTSLACHPASQASMELF